MQIIYSKISYSRLSINQIDKNMHSFDVDSLLKNVLISVYRVHATVVLQYIYHIAFGHIEKSRNMQPYNRC